ncbi:tetratricopeptide repeat protein [Candidatus Poribacteria bacterium]|nr:tetratricopeptide repeat protein [Candidatus Poribacteria bacterium]MYK20356.1 tetratricopeptide repeat protein [Candidatus Poribacteria bacterium]
MNHNPTYEYAGIPLLIPITRSLIFLILLIIAGCDLDTAPDKMDPQLAAHYQRGIDALDRRDFAEAEKAFRACLQMDPNTHDARMQLARTYIRQMKFTAAEVELQMLIGLLKQTPRAQDKLSRAYLTLAQVFSYQQRFSDSTAALTNALEVSPDDTDARIRLGYFLGAPQQMLVPDLSASKRQFEKVLELEPNNLEAMLQLGLAEFRLGEADKAAERFENIIENYRRHSGAYYYLGVYHLRHGDSEKAVANFKESLRLKPRDPETLWNLWTAYNQLGGYPEDLPEEFKIVGGSSDSRLLTDSRQPTAERQFTDIAPDLKMDKVDGGRGSAWGDYDNDGDLDIVAVGTYQPHVLYRNNGDGTFTNVAEQAGVADPRGGWGSLFADYDNDGYPDLYITRGGWSGAAENTLYHNNGDGTFTDVTHTAGVADPQSSFCAAWADYDNDGYIDLYIANGVIGDGAANVLYRNNGDGTFTNTAEIVGVANTGNSLGTAWGDYDKDGYIDLHVVNYGQSNVLYRNNGDGTFTDVTAAAGMSLAVTDAFVTFFLDVDNDADLDLFISNSGSFQAFIAGQITGSATYDSDRQVLYRNNGDGTFTDVTKESGLYHAYGAMGANFGDINSDGYVDIYLATGAPQMGRLERDALFQNNGDGTFTDATVALGLGNIGKGHGVTFGDADADGDVDIYVPVGGAFIGDQWHNLFYQNAGTGNNYLTLKLVGVKSNRDGIGAKVTLNLGDSTIYREVSGGCGFGSTNSLSLEIGLGTHTKVDTLEIIWPSGQVDTHRNLSVNQRLILTEGEDL